MIAFFEVINTSAPHIYHSALPLSPRTSIVHNRYKQCARPLTRVVWGAPASWEQGIVTTYGDGPMAAVAWSPCSRFIAIATHRCRMVQLLDAATLWLLDVFRPPNDQPSAFPSLSFSPNSRSVTLYARGRILTWDLQTGGQVADFPAEFEDISSSTYSMDGRFFAVSSKSPFKGPVSITAYDLLLGTRTDHSHASTGCVVPPIWTHGGCIRFATVETRSITISEVEPASERAPVEVVSFPAPDRIAHADEYLFLPALSRLAFVLREAVEVWDAQHSRTLLECTEDHVCMMSFSADGHLFAYVVDLGEGVRVWKESATGYELHQQLPPGAYPVAHLVLSPSGKSIIMARPAIHLLSTADPTLLRSTVPTQSSKWSNILAFSTDEPLVAIARKWGNIITVVDLKSDYQRLAVQTGTGIEVLGVAGSILIAADRVNMIAWAIPTGDRVCNAWVNRSNSVWTAILDQPGLSPTILFASASISLGRNHIAVASCHQGPGYLTIYDTSTGEYLGGIELGEGTPQFTPDGREVWVVGPHSARGWAIVEKERSGLVVLEPLESTARPPVFRRRSSSREHHVHDGWVLNSAQERILWLPNHWRSEELDREWSGRFLGLLHSDLPEAVILELACD